MPNSVRLLSNCCFRPALPPDRRQIRLLLRSYSCDSHSSRWQSTGRLFCVGLLLALMLHWLLALGGLQLLLCGVLGCSAVGMACWLNLWLFEDWQNYWVVERNKRLIACGKLTHYKIYSVLSNLVVAPEHRQRGIGSLLVISIAQVADQTANQPLYLACKPNLIQFYQRLGFVSVESQLLSAYLREELGLNQQPKLLVLRFAKSD